jgi:hypothetical protein
MELPLRFATAITSFVGLLAQPHGTCWMFMDSHVGGVEVSGFTTLYNTSTGHFIRAFHLLALFLPPITTRQSKSWQTQRKKTNTITTLLFSPWSSLYWPSVLLCSSNSFSISSVSALWVLLLVRTYNAFRFLRSESLTPDCKQAVSLLGSRVGLALPGSSVSCNAPLWEDKALLWL